MITTPRDYFEEISRFKPISGIFLTYTLDIEVVEKLLEECPGNIIILHDYRKGVTLTEQHHHKAVCLPVVFPQGNERNCFHPKMALLRNNEEALFMIGSANLSKDAFVRDKELMASSRLPLHHPICSDAIALLESLAPYMPEGADLLRESLERFKVYMPSTTDKRDEQLFFNTTDSVFERLKEWLPKEPFESVHVISPFLSPKDSASLEAFRNAFVSKRYRFHLRQPAAVTSAIKAVFPDSDSVSPPGQRTFHYKAYVFRSRSWDYLAVGSANFTTQGFFRGASTQGNLEGMLLLRQKRSEEVTKWLEKNWSKPKRVSDINENDEAFAGTDESFFQDEPYAFATKQEDEVAVSLFLPKQFDIGRVIVKPKMTKKWQAIRHAPGLYETTVPTSQHVKISYENPEWEVKLTVFDPEHFAGYYSYFGDELFGESEKTYSVKRKELEQELRRHGRSMRFGGVSIAQRPLLEQFFRNVVDNLSKLSAKKYFSSWHEQELNDTLQKDAGATCFYLALKLHSFFSNHPGGSAMARICRKRLDELSMEKEFSGLDKKLLMKFTHTVK